MFRGSCSPAELVCSCAGASDAFAHDDASAFAHDDAGAFANDDAGAFAHDDSASDCRIGKMKKGGPYVGIVNNVPLFVVLLTVSLKAFQQVHRAQPRK